MNLEQAKQMVYEFKEPGFYVGNPKLWKNTKLPDQVGFTPTHKQICDLLDDLITEVESLRGQIADPWYWKRLR